MAGTFIDDGFATHYKRRVTSLAADGLWARALAEAGRQGRDGFVDEAWFRHQGDARERRRALADAVAHRLLEPLPAGVSRTVVGRSRPGLRTREITVEIGPFNVDGFLVHDYLDWNLSVAERDARRSAERTRKRRQRAHPNSSDPDSDAVLPPPVPPDVPELSRSRDSRLGGGSTETPNGDEPLDARARVVEDVLGILCGAERFTVDSAARGGVESALAAHPGKDPIAAAHTAVTWVSDPAFRKTSATGVFLDALAKQPAPPRTRSGREPHMTRCPDCGARFDRADPNREHRNSSRCDGCTPSYLQRERDTTEVTT